MSCNHSSLFAAIEHDYDRGYFPVELRQQQERKTTRPLSKMACHGRAIPYLFSEQHVHSTAIPAPQSTLRNLANGTQLCFNILSCVMAAPVVPVAQERKGAPKKKAGRPKGSVAQPLADSDVELLTLYFGTTVKNGKAFPPELRKRIETKYNAKGTVATDKFRGAAL